MIIRYNCSINITQISFNDIFEEWVKTKSIIAKFKPIRSICYKQAHEPKLLNEAEVIDQFATNPSMSVRKPAAETWLFSKRNKKLHKFHSYKLLTT